MAAEKRKLGKPEKWEERYRRVEDITALFTFRSAKEAKRTAQNARKLAQMIADLLNAYTPVIKRQSRLILRQLDKLSNEELGEYMAQGYPQQKEVNTFMSDFNQYQTERRTHDDVAEEPATGTPTTEEIKLPLNCIDNVDTFPSAEQVTIFRTAYSDMLIRLSQTDSITGFINKEFGIDIEKDLGTVAFIAQGLLRDSPTFKAVKRQVNPKTEAVAKIKEATLGYRSDTEEGIAELWDQGAKPGEKLPNWETARAKSKVKIEGTKTTNALSLMAETILSYLERASLWTALKDASRPTFISYLKKASYNRRIDRARAQQAKKRRPPSVEESDIIDEKTVQEGLDRLAKDTPSYSASQQMLDSLAQDVYSALTPQQIIEELINLLPIIPNLTKQERKVVDIYSKAASEGKKLTPEEVGKILKVTPRRIYQIQKSVFKKIDPFIRKYIYE